MRSVFFVCILNGNANFSARRQCLYRLNYHATSSSIWNLFVRVCFSKKYQTDKSLLDQNLSSKHPHNAIRSAQHLNPVSRATSKLLIKIAAPDWFLNISIFCCCCCFFFFFFFFANHSASFSDNCISSFLDSVHSHLFVRKFMEIDRFTLRAATIYLGFLSNLISRLPPPT